MRVQILSVMASMAIAFAFAPASPAQEGVPYGSYQQTCQDIRSNGDRLSARCQRVDGGWNDTSLDFRNCRGEVVNDNGNLRCGGENRGYDNRDAYDNRGYDNRAYDNHGYGDNRGYGRGEGGLPRGDYKRTCRNMSVNGDRLYATCEKVDGGWRSTSLKHFDRCQSMIVNDNGSLRCQR
jgi:CVNH domain